LHKLLLSAACQLVEQRWVFLLNFLDVVDLFLRQALAALVLRDEPLQLPRAQPVEGLVPCLLHELEVLVLFVVQLVLLQLLQVAQRFLESPNRVNVVARILQQLRRHVAQVVPSVFSAVEVAEVLRLHLVFAKGFSFGFIFGLEGALVRDHDFGVVVFD